MKRRGRPTILFSLFVSLSPLIPQDSPDSSYYPLGMGYQWTYDSNSFSRTETIRDTARFAGELYYGLSVWGDQVEHWLREDSGRVYLLNPVNTTEFLLFDFDADTGASWDLPSGYECSFGTRITLTGERDTVITPADTFFNSYHFEHQRGCSDAGMLDTWFVKGVGKVRFREDNISGMLEYNLSSYSLVILTGHEGQSLIGLSYQLGLNFPNPFNPSTTIEFSVPQRETVTLTVYDLLGREVETILNQPMDAGNHKIQWNAGNVPSGVYFVRMQAGDFSQVRKVTVLR